MFVTGDSVDEAQLLWAVGSLQRQLREVEEGRLAAAAAATDRQRIVDALQACVPWHDVVLQACCTWHDVGAQVPSLSTQKPHRAA